MPLLLRAIDRIAAAGAAVAAFACLALAVMMVVEVISTSFLNWSQPWAVEYSGYLLAATLFGGAGWTLRQGGHIRVTVATQALPAEARRVADLLASAFALGIACFATWALTEHAWRSFERGSESYYPTRTPLVYPQAVLAAAFAILTLALLARLIRLLRREEADVPQETIGDAQ